jgi:hypothetical protein
MGHNVVDGAYLHTRLSRIKLMVTASRCGLNADARMRVNKSQLVVCDARPHTIRAAEQAAPIYFNRQPSFSGSIILLDDSSRSVGGEKRCCLALYTVASVIWPVPMLFGIRRFWSGSPRRIEWGMERKQG